MTEEQTNNYNQIKDYYQRAWNVIKGKSINDICYDVKEATDILYDEMPVKLYDLSLDILYNRNEIFTDKPLKELIAKVSNALEPITPEELDLENDNFSDIF